MSGKLDDAKIDLESNYTFAEGKKLEKIICIWNLDASKVALCGAKLFRAQTNWNLKGDESFNHKHLEVEILKKDWKCKKNCNKLYMWVNLKVERLLFWKL